VCRGEKELFRATNKNEDINEDQGSGTPRWSGRHAGSAHVQSAGGRRRRLRCCCCCCCCCVGGVVFVRCGCGGKHSGDEGVAIAVERVTWERARPQELLAPHSQDYDKCNRRRQPDGSWLVSMSSGCQIRFSGDRREEVHKVEPMDASVGADVDSVQA
jgi:hypothetical protein